MNRRGGRTLEVVPHFPCGEKKCAQSIYYMNRIQNIVLVLAVLVSSAINYYVFTNNFSLKDALKNIPTNDGYSSPIGAKPSKAWEQSWEAERAK